MNSKERKNLSLFAITWPIMIEVFLYMLMGSVDTMMLSKVSDDAVAAVGVTNQIISIAIVMFGFITSGAGIIIAQYLGANQKEKAIEMGSISIGVNFIFGVVISVVMIAFSNSFLNLMNVPMNLQDFSRTYLLIVGGFLFIQSSMMSAGTVLRVHQFTKDAMFITLGMNILNVVGNFLFIFGVFGIPKLGVTGVAISTIISKTIGFFIVLFLLRKRLKQSFKVKEFFKFKKEYVLNILKIGVPSAGEHLAYNSSQLMITYLITFIGANALATKVYAQNISMFIFLFAVSIGQGTQILVGHLVGANKMDEAYHRCIKSLKISILVSLILAAIFSGLSRPLFSIFTDNAEVIQLGSTLLLLNILLEPGRTFNLVVINSLRAAGDVTFPVIMGIISMWGVSVTLSYILGIKLGLGLIGVWIAFSIDEWFRGIFMLFRWKSRIWERKRLITKVPEDE